MFRKFFATVLSVTLIFTAFGFRSARAQTGKDTDAEKVRANGRKMNIGRDARVEVRMRDKTKLKGYLSATGQETFTVTDAKTGATRTLAYADVMQLRKPGGGLSTRALVIIGVAVVAAVIVGATVIRPVVCDGGAGC
ncbi:MAG: hypothetical protein ABR577_04040 [Pyrinomonadaceae bacterium]